jgi:hypothetical protein
MDKQRKRCHSGNVHHTRGEFFGKQKSRSEQSHRSLLDLLVAACSTVRLRILFGETSYRFQEFSGRSRAAFSFVPFGMF